MSRPTFLRCAGFMLALVCTALVVAWVNTPTAPVTDATSSATSSLPFVSITLFAWPLVQGVLSP